MTATALVICAIPSYLLGSIPTGYLMARARGVDIRSVGSGNIGATNVFRILGKGPGILTLAIDCLKGLAAVLAVPVLVTRALSTPANEWMPLVCALGAILGHNYTCWLKFRGGKGIATSAGAFLGLAPWALLVCLGVWIVTFAASRYVSLASIVAAAALPVAVWFTAGRDSALFWATLALSALAIWKHKSNIQRLLNGTENRFTRKPAPHNA